MTTTTATTTTTKRHPIRGFLYGIVFGLGLALIAVGQKWAALGTWPPVLLLVAGIVVGTLWSTVGPARAPIGPGPGTPADTPDGSAPLTADVEDTEMH